MGLSLKFSSMRKTSKEYNNSCSGIYYSTETKTQITTSYLAGTRRGVTNISSSDSLAESD